MLSVLTALLGNLLLWAWWVAAVFLWLATRDSRRWRSLATICLIGSWLLACRPIAELFMRPLEERYPRPSIAALAERHVRQVVVLTGGGFPINGELVASALPPASARRFLAGMELCARLGPDCRLIFSGSAGRGNRNLTTAFAMRDLAQELAPRARVAAEARSGSTAEHPENVAPLLEDGLFALVTSAYHMPRAMRSFRRAGLEPIPYPVATSVRGSYRWTSWLPSAGAVSLLHLACREYQALILYSILGW